MVTGKGQMTTKYRNLGKVKEKKINKKFVCSKLCNLNIKIMSF